MSRLDKLKPIHLNPLRLGSVFYFLTVLIFALAYGQGVEGSAWEVNGSYWLLPAIGCAVLADLGLAYFFKEKEDSLVYRILNLLPEVAELVIAFIFGTFYFKGFGSAPMSDLWYRYIVFAIYLFLPAIQLLIKALPFFHASFFEKPLQKEHYLSAIRNILIIALALCVLAYYRGAYAERDLADEGVHTALTIIALVSAFLGLVLLFLNKIPERISRIFSVALSLIPLIISIVYVVTIDHLYIIDYPTINSYYRLIVWGMGVGVYGIIVSSVSLLLTSYDFFLSERKR